MQDTFLRPTPIPAPSRVLSAVLLTVFIVAVGGAAISNLQYFVKAAAAYGPNTVGEAGKVYFAKSFQRGEPVFRVGTEPPYYPSVHGALFHVVVGTLGRWTDASPQSLYYIGRAISIGATIVTLILVAAILRRFQIGVFWMVMLCIVFFAVRPVVGHAVSFRPDHWVLALSAFTCYLLLVGGNRWWVLGLASITPTLAFFMKATGLAILLATGLALILTRRWGRAFLYIAASLSILLATITITNVASGGVFLAALRTGVKVPFSYDLVLNTLDVPQLWIPLISPMFLLLRRPWRRDGWQSRACTVLAAFWIVTLVYGLLGAARLGSNAYYFVESFTYGLILAMVWVADVRKGWNRPFAGWNMATIALVALLYSMQSLPGEIRHVLNPFPDPALMETIWFAEDRDQIAREANNLAIRCFSDDPGLNVLFNRPVVIDPMVQSHLIAGGSLDIQTLVGPVERREYDLIVLATSPPDFHALRRWHYHDMPHLPEAFMEAVERHYVVTDKETRYLTMEPRRGPSQ